MAILNFISPKLKSILIFISKALLLLIIWVGLTTYFPQLISQFHFVLIKLQTVISGWIFEIMGYEFSADFFSKVAQSVISINGTQDVLIGPGCSGMELFVIFAGLIFILKGNWVRKIIFTFIGLLVILFLNIIRIVSLALIHHHAPQYLDFNHKYTFVLFIYMIIFGLWMQWVNKYSKNNSDESQ